MTAKRDCQGPMCQTTCASRSGLGQNGPRRQMSVKRLKELVDVDVCLERLSKEELPLPKKTPKVPSCFATLSG
eukprot:1720740-Amphidinium_carterae.1